VSAYIEYISKRNTTAKQMINNNPASPALLTLTLLLIGFTFVINNTIRPLFNHLVAQHKHKRMIEARRKEFYAGLSAIMNSERTPGHRG
jgi:hypothetical protein